MNFIDDLVEMLPDMASPTLVNMYAIAVKNSALDETDDTVKRACELYKAELNRRLAN